MTLHRESIQNLLQFFYISFELCDYCSTTIRQSARTKNANISNLFDTIFMTKGSLRRFSPSQNSDTSGVKNDMAPRLQSQRKFV
jgi:hypothetical protein